MAPSIEINSLSNNNTKDKRLCYEKDASFKDSLKSELEEKSRTYRAKRTFATRKEESAAIRSKFPTKIPIIVDRFYKEVSLPKLDKCKFLVPQEITMSQFVTIIRNRMKLSSNQAFYLLVNNRSMLSMSKTLAEVYSEYKDDDGFLYVTYASQEVFG